MSRADRGSGCARRLAGARWAALLPLVLALGGCPTPPYPSCTHDEHCEPHGELCVDRRCVACRVDADCGDEAECVDGGCVAMPAPPGCTSDTECPPDHRCRRGRCVAPSLRPGCRADTECPPGQGCEGGRCVPHAECVDSSSCPPGMRCAAGACVEDGPPSHAPCRGARDCQEGEDCVDGRCASRALVTPEWSVGLVDALVLLDYRADFGGPDWCRAPEALLKRLAAHVNAPAGGASSARSRCSARFSRWFGLVPTLLLKCELRRSGACADVYGAQLWGERSRVREGDWQLEGVGWVLRACSTDAPRPGAFAAPGAGRAVERPTSAFHTFLAPCREPAITQRMGDRP